MFETIDRALPPLAGLVNNAGVVDLARARRRDDAGAPAAHVRDQRLRQLLLRPRGGPAHDDQGRRRRPRRRARRRRDRQRLVGGGQARRAGPVRRLRGGQGRDRDLHHRPGARRSRPKASASTRSGPASSRPRSTPRAARPTGCAQMLPLLPMQRAGTAEEVAEAIVLLLSDAASYTTGSILEVTGGR